MDLNFADLVRAIDEERRNRHRGPQHRNAGSTLLCQSEPDLFFAERAAAKVAAGQTALVNVVTDWRARSGTANFTNYVT